METSGSVFTLNFINNSRSSGSIAIFQLVNTPNVLPVVWMSRFTQPGMQTRFQWEEDNCFVCGNGTVRPGANFSPTQMLDADLDNANKVTLSNADGSLQLTNQTQGEKGRLTIQEDAGIPQNSVVGIGMSGATTLVAQALSNTTISFPPKGLYCAAFGNYETGMIIDESTADGGMIIEFSDSNNLTLTLNADNSWTINLFD